jgi:hypothetical protein
VIGLRGASSTLAVAAAVCAVERPAHADVDEAALDVQVLGGAARLDDADVLRGDGVARLPVGGLAARMSYGARRHVAIDAGLVLLRTGVASYEEVIVDSEEVQLDGSFARATTLARLEVGPTLRLGVRFVPTLHVGVGAQARVGGTGLLQTHGVQLATQRNVELDLVASAAVGFDLRLGRHWLAGVSVGGAHGLPLTGGAFDSVEGGVHLAWYWYPGWTITRP